MINIIGLAIIIVFTVYAYKTAKDYDRNAPVWALITFCLGFFLQIIVPFFVAVIYTIAMLSNGSSPYQIEENFPAFIITILGILLSLASGLFLLNYLSRVPEEKPFIPPPEPPQNFN